LFSAAREWKFDAHSKSKLPKPVRLLCAMTLGWKTALTGEVSEPFMRSGTISQVPVLQTGKIA